MSARNPTKKLCIFCGAPANSGEHVWPDWLQAYIPNKTSHRTHFVKSRFTDFKVSKKTKPGDVRSGKLDVTCRRCNSGWISIVDKNVKPVLLALADGRWGHFTPWQRRVFAAWAARFTMVYELANPTTAVSTFEEREYLRLYRQPPEKWFVFVGYYSGTKWVHQWNHRSFEKKLDVPSSVTDRDKGQSTIAILGRLIFNVVSGPVDHLEMSAYARHFGLQGVWPESFPSFGAPANVFDDGEVDTLSAWFGGDTIY